MARLGRMTARRWWWVAVLGMAALTGVLAIVNLQTPWRLTLALTGIALLVVAWAVVGDRRAESESPSWTLVLLVTAAAGIGTAGYPTLAILQALAYPISWVFAARSRDAVVGNVLIAVAVGVGFAIGIGTGPEDIIQIIVTQSLALGFSLAMGFWITRMVELGEERGRLLTELQGAQEQIAALHRDAGAAAEREHLARELHDTIAQDLTGLVMLAQRARREGAGAVETLALIEENARGVLAETRALVAAGADPRLTTTELWRPVFERAGGIGPPYIAGGFATPLMAAIRGASNRGRFFLASERDPEAEERNALETVALAVELGADVNATDRNGDTALHGAASRNFTTIVRLLATHGADLDVENDAGRTPLALAIAAEAARGRRVVATSVPSGNTAEVLRELGATEEQKGDETEDESR